MCDAFINHNQKNHNSVQNQDNGLGCLGHMAGDVIFILSVLWFLWSSLSHTHVREFSDSTV